MPNMGPYGRKYFNRLLLWSLQSHWLEIFDRASLWWDLKTLAEFCWSGSESGCRNFFSLCLTWGDRAFFDIFINSSETNSSRGLKKFWHMYIIKIHLHEQFGIDLDHDPYGVKTLVKKQNIMPKFCCSSTFISKTTLWYN